MYYLLSLLVGSVISVMVFLNGKLTAGYGAYPASVIIHIVGVVFAGTICFVKKEKMRSHAPLWAYMGGAIGVLTTLFNNYAFGRVSMTSIVVLTLLFQPSFSIQIAGHSPFIYFGGVLGVVTVLLFNITVPRISAFRLTLLSFVGQIFTGILLDFVFGAEFSTSTFTGGGIIAAGLLINMILEQWDNFKKRKEDVSDSLDRKVLTETNGKA